MLCSCSLSLFGVIELKLEKYGANRISTRNKNNVMLKLQVTSVISKICTKVEVGRTRMSATTDQWFQFPSRMKLYGLMDRTKYIHDKHTAHIRGLKIIKKKKKKKKKEQWETGEISQKQELKLRPTVPCSKMLKNVFRYAVETGRFGGCGGLRAYLIPTCVGALTKTYVHTYTYITN